MNGDKPPKKRAWDTLPFHRPRKPPGPDAVPPATAQPPPVAAPPPTTPPTHPPTPPAAPPPVEGKAPSAPAAAPPEPAPAAEPVPEQAAELRKKLGAVFTAAPAEEEDRKGGAAALRGWSKDAFTLTPEQAKRDLDPKVQLTRLFDVARKRPVLSTFVLLFVVGVLVADAVMIARKMGIDDFLMISADLGQDASRRFEVWQRRGSGLSYIAGAPGHEKEVAEPAQQAAVDGKAKLPDKPLETPKLSGGLAGILTPEELREGMRASLVSGIDAAMDAKGDAAAPMTHAFLKTAKDDFSPYAPGAKGGHEPPMGIYFGKAGESLENYASISNGATAAPGYGRADGSQRRQVPEGVHGNDLVSNMLDPELSQQIGQYSENKGGDWKLHKMEQGEATPRAELAGITLLDNDAVIQLLETKRSTDRSLYCAECETMTRVWDARAPFYGEQH